MSGGVKVRDARGERQRHTHSPYRVSACVCLSVVLRETYAVSFAEVPKSLRKSLRRVVVHVAKFWFQGSFVVVGSTT